jgi:hypothetical protein
MTGCASGRVGGAAGAHGPRDEAQARDLAGPAATERGVWGPASGRVGGTAGAQAPRIEK